MPVAYQIGPWEFGPLTWGAHEELRALGSAYVSDVETTDWTAEIVAAIAVTGGIRPETVRRKLNPEIVRAWSAWWETQTQTPKFAPLSGVPYAASSYAHEYGARQAGVDVNDATPFQTVIQSAFAHWADRGFLRLLTPADRATEEELARLRVIFDQKYGEQG